MNKDQMQKALVAVGSLRAFSARTGIPRRTLQRARDGVGTPTVGTALRLSIALLAEERREPEKV